MRRRRQKNTLLPKMLGLAVLVNAILLPLLAQLGVFKVLKGQRVTPVQLVQAPPLPPRPRTRANKTRPHVVHHQQTARRAAPRAGVARPALSHPNLMAGNPKGTGSGGPEVNPNGTGKPGQVPKIPGKLKPAAKPAPVPAPAPTPMPVPTPPQPVPVPTPAPAPPHVPELVKAMVAHEVDPQIPADFSDETLPVTFRAAFHVHADGTATVEPVASTGDKTLDQLALDAARRWTFRPATEDGKPVDSYLRLTVDFVPNGEG